MTEELEELVPPTNNICQSDTGSPENIKLNEFIHEMESTLESDGTEESPKRRSQLTVSNNTLRAQEY
jgi:hypothetical protein